MKLELEWRIPWPADWSRERKIRAAERLVEYVENGTLFETSKRMRAHAEVVVDTALREPQDPYLTIRLEK